MEMKHNSKTCAAVLFSLLGLGLAACQNEDARLTSYDNDASAVHFHTTIGSGVASRTTTDADGQAVWAQNDEIKIYASATADANEAMTEEQAKNYRYGEDGRWAPVIPGKYHAWEKSTMTFAACYPANANTSLTSFTLNSDQSTLELLQASDWMTADATQQNKPENGTNVNLKFTHRLSKVTVNIRFGTSEESPNTSPKIYTQTPVAGNGVGLTGNNQIQFYTHENGKSGIGILIPGSLDGGTELFRLVYSTTESTTAERVMSVKVPQGGMTFRAGTHYTLDLILGRDKVDISSVNVEEWGDEVKIGEDIQMVHFPDENFRKVLVSMWCELTADGNDIDIEASRGAFENIYSLSIYNKGISNLNGIKYLTNLEDLHCSGNQLTSLDVSGCANLNTLDCNGNQLTSLDVSGCDNLYYLDCHNNQLTSLNVSGYANLNYLYCSDNQLTSLDVSECASLKLVSCLGNQLTSLNVSGYTKLEDLYCNGNQLTSLDVSGCAYLKTLYCYENQLTSLNVGGFTNLKTLYCQSNQLTSLDVSGCANLNRLDCNGNQLTSLDVSGCANLNRLDCNGNQLTSLDVSRCTNLDFLYCSDNHLTSLDASTLAGALWALYCGNQKGSADLRLTLREDQEERWVANYAGNTNNKNVTVTYK